MERIADFLLSTFFGLFRFLRADPHQLRAIVLLKLKTDNRRHPGVRRTQNSESNYAFLLTVLVYSVFGCFIGVLIYAMPSIMMGMMIYFAYLITMVAMTLITDFSSILLDTSDNTIILPRPVSGRTLYIARLVHVLLYLGQLTLGLSVPAAIAVALKYESPVLMAFIVLSIVAVVIALLITNGIYLIVLNYFNESKLRNIINTIQIGMGILMMAGYQIFPRLASALQQQEDFEVSGWYWMLPPVWLASILEHIHELRFNALFFINTTMVVILPVLGLTWVTRHMTPLFNRKLGALSVGEKKISGKKKSFDVVAAVSTWVTFRGAERAMFGFVYKLMGREQKFKLKVYPLIGYMMIFTLIIIFRNGLDVEDTIENAQQAKFHLVIFYLPFLIVQTACREIVYSDEFKASWIYTAAPLRTAGELLSGTVKAIIIRLLIPSYVIISMIVLFVWGPGKWIELLFALINNYLMTMTLVLLQNHKLPFSVAPDVRRQSGNLIRGIIIAVVLGGIAIVHYFLSSHTTWLFMAIPVQLGIAIATHYLYRRTRWDEITA